MSTPPWDIESVAPDLAILIALPEEFQTLAADVSADWYARQSAEHTGYDYFFVGPRDYRCVATIMNGMGPTRAVTFTQYLLDWKPALVVNIGIAGGLKSGDLRIGDVLVPSEVAAYIETAKMSATWERRGKNYQPSPNIVDKIPHLAFAHRDAFTKWGHAGQEDLQRLLKPAIKKRLIKKAVLREAPVTSTKHLASGDFVVASKWFADWIREANGDIHAAEMEAAGMMLATECRAKPVDTLVIRGISDHVDVPKAELDAMGDGALRGLAMRNAWRLFKMLMELELLPRATSSAPTPHVTIPYELRSTPQFVGRQHEIEELTKGFRAGPATVAITAVHGMPGIGKSYLAEHFATTHKDRFPGGVVRVALDPEDSRSLEQIEEVLAAKLNVDRRMLAGRLQALRTLVLVENVDSDALVKLVVRLLDPHKAYVNAIVTGRVQGIGTSRGWRQVPLGRMSEETALMFFAECGILMGTALERTALKTLAHEVKYLPLALALAAGYLRGGTVDGFLQELRASKLSWAPADLAEEVDDSVVARRVLASSFEISLRVLEREIGADGRRAFEMMGAVLRQPFGADLGRAVTGLERGPFERLCQVATHLSLLDLTRASATAPRFDLHPLLAEHLGHACADAREGFERLQAWFAPRMDPGENAAAAERSVLDAEILAEFDMLTSWLERLPDGMALKVSRRFNAWGNAHGPYASWAQLHLRAADVADDARARSAALGRAAYVLRLAGDYDRSQAVAETKAAECGDDKSRSWAIAQGQVAEILYRRGELDEALRICQEEQLPVYERLGDARARAATLGKVAEILFRRGEWDEALRIRREEVLPVYERLGDVRARAVTYGKIADILKARGELDEALRIRREEELPVYERLGDVRSRAVALGKIADSLHARGELDEALRIRREEELSVYERLGDVRERAVTLGKVADIFRARGDLDEALRIRREEQLPVYERLGDVRLLLVGRCHLALTLAKRGRPEDAPEINQLLALALADARRLRLPEAQQIESIVRRRGLDPNAPPFV